MMNEPGVAASSSAVSDLVQQIESLWELGQNPDPDALLREAGVSLPAEVARVLATDQWHRWHAGERLWVEDYFARHPAVGADPEAALVLVYGEFLLREERGEQPSPAEYLSRFPQCAPGLRRQLDFHAEVAGTRSTLSASENAPGELGATPLCSTSTSMGSPTADQTRSIPSSPQTDSDPVAIGRYRVIRRLGQGGFGRVYLALDTELDRQVAVKVPNAERVAGPENVENYLAEARMVAKLDHPQIVPVYDFGRTGDGLCYVVSKFIEGSDLKARIEQGRPSFRDSVELVATVAEALHYAHTRGLVHRDIKPGNILIDASGKPFLADFGLALKEEDFGRGARIAGTPAYMSPEQARGEGHRVDGRSDIFSLAVVLYELLTGRRPFATEDRNELLDLIATTEARPPRQIDDTIPKETERICLKAMSKRAADRFTTARDMAEDLRECQKTAAGAVPPVAGPALVAQEAAQVPTSRRRSDSDQPRIKVIPKGLRSFDERDADFFLELLPGPRDREGLPESIRFWKTRIEELDADKTFSAGLIYGPSGCGKSSLVKAGLLPRLAKHVVTVYIEATAEETENRLAIGLRKVCPDLPIGLNLADSLAAVRKGRILRSGKKLLLVLDQFEQWLHARRGERETELVTAVRQCDGEHVQVIVMVRDDFWLGVSRFLADLEVELVQGQNTALVDLFDPEHARKVLRAFGAAYGKLSERDADLTGDHHAFLDRSISELAQDGKVVSVRLALFAEMVKARPWTPASLKAIGGTEGVGITFLEETFSSPQANPKHRLHQKAAQAVLRALLPQTGTTIKGQMRSEQELREAAAYSDRPRDFAELMHILDAELRLITPTEERMKNEGGRMTEENPAAQVSDRGPNISQPSAFRYYQLTHDYLVHSLRNWLTRKQRETRRGRAELRLAERAELWNAKPENRRLPSVLEWASIRALTKKTEWTDTQRRMMRRAGRFHGLRALGTMVVLGAALLIGLEISRRVDEANQRTIAKGLVDQVVRVKIGQVPGIVKSMDKYRRWTDPVLRQVVGRYAADSPERLHASLALLPVDDGQADYLYARLLHGDADEAPVLSDALKPHQNILVPRLWQVFEASKSGDVSLLPAASSLARYDPENVRWVGVGAKTAEALVKIDAIYLRPWLDALRPVRGRLAKPLATIFRDSKGRSESQYTQATGILTDYAGDDPGLIAGLLLDSDEKAYGAFFPIAENLRAATLPLLHDEITKKLAHDWNDPALDKSWVEPDSAAKSRIESAHGIVAERFALCQTMPLDEFPAASEALKASGYCPIRFRPHTDGQVVRVAAVWTRDGRKWRPRHDQSADQIRDTDGRNRKEGFHPVDVVGYVTAGRDGRPAERYAALWVEKSGDDDARLYVGLTADEEAEVQAQLRDAKLIPRTLQALRGLDGRLRYCGVWGRPSPATITAQSSQDLFEGDLAQTQARLSDQSIVDASISPAARPQTIPERAHEALARADKQLKAKADNLSARLARVLANVRLGENQKALDDLQAIIGKDPENDTARQYRVIVLARLGKKQAALTELASFQKADVSESSKLFLAAVVAAELGEKSEKAVAALDAALGKQPKDADLRYEAARAFALASKAVAAKDKAKGDRLAGRALELLKQAVADDEADLGRIDDDLALDPVRDASAFVEVMTAGHPDRRYAGVWTSAATHEAIPVYGLDPTAQKQRCRELMSQGYRPVSLSVARTSPEGPPATASVWHGPVISDEVKDRLAERQARAAIALLCMGKAEEVWPLLRHSPDPRLRSFIVNWLNPLGADPNLIASQLATGNDVSRPHAPREGADITRSVMATLATGPPSAGQLATQKMDSILFHPETSIRRALILALGTYGPGALSPGEREPLTDKLLDLYKNDPDSGIHAGAEWTLRQWNEQAKLKAAGEELSDLKNWGGRRWFVNKEGQTFALIEGPVEFTMGSPPTEPDRLAGNDLSPHRVTIPRRFAIAAKEVTVAQFQRFLKQAAITEGRYLVPADFLNRYSPDPDGPWIAPDWYAAAHYCNWVSEQEGLPRDQWCYVPAAGGAYAEGMTIPADVLERKGYRLPTEAEWEYACRAGAITSRYYGVSVDLLGKYARYFGNSANHAWPAGSLFPNDLGLFDMLGNEFEWCQDREGAPRFGRKTALVDEINISEYIIVTHPRLLRGGAFVNRPANVRSAFRGRFVPSNRDAGCGFRLLRTYN
jgi:serine/threonine protein kinase/formylglycine-generating enzyme required for sulfatase activity